MRPYHEYTPDQSYLLPPSLDDLIAPDDPVRFLREVLPALDLGGFHAVYRAERGRPPYDPEMMLGLLLYGHMRRIRSSRRLAEACRRDVAFIYLAGRATPDFHTISEFRKRFTQQTQEIFVQVLLLCREAGLVRLGHVSLDGTKIRANASKHKAMSYGRMLSREKALEEEVARWQEEAERQDREEDARYGPDDDGYSLPPELAEPQERLQRIREAKARLEQQARARAAAEGREPAEAVVAARAQTNFTDPESRIMHTPDGFQQCYNGQAAVDASSQVIVACELSAAPPDVQRLIPMLERINELNGRYPDQLSADAGYASEANFAALAEAQVHAVIALRRYHHDEPPDADPAARQSSRRWPHRNAMRERLQSADGKALYKLRKQTVEPVFGQIKAARGFRQFLRRGLAATQSEWTMACTVHNLLKLHQAWQVA
ncbi:MAG: IS1182 family transposase [Dehalococcoidia bacterium]|nr:IS1182 family transposase [Chloroflexi bacterium CFX7]MCK6565515.1 IS1182 family transposase [Dehalococcoidia bacterium]NUQ54528.1 IS1182 family transposase [Dehalococcoidia bacterium]